METSTLNSKKPFTPKDLIISGVLAGGSIEFANVIRKEQRYLKIFQFMGRYPGISLMATTSIFGIGVMYKDSFVGFYDQLKSAFIKSQ